MDNEALLYIEDDKKRKLFYRFTPAAVVSNFVPLIVILDTKNGAEAMHFEYKMWNVLTPLDHFGYEKQGSCWLGEKGDFFVKDLLQKLIEEISQEYECENHIYLYGSGIDGYGAILHAILCQANALYAQAPYIRVPKTKNADTAEKRFYDAIFAGNLSKENDLTHFLNPDDPFPVFYLCQEKSVKQKHREDETVYFANACKNNRINVHLDFCPTIKENETQVIKEVLDFFERVDSVGRR